MDKENIICFLGVKILTPLEEKSTVGGRGHHDHGNNHQHDKVSHDQDGTQNYIQ